MSLASRLSWGAVTGAVVVISMELTTRLDDWAQFRVPFLSEATSLGDLIVTDSVGTHARPNSQFKQFRINARGYRGAESADGMPASPLVVVSGASESFGLYESAGKDWPSQLQDSLKTTCPSPLAVVNAAFAGMSLPTVAQDIELRIARDHPRVGVYYPTPMQYMEASLPSAPARSPGAASALPVARLRFVPRLRDAIKRSTPDRVLDILRRLDTERARSTSEEPPLGTPEPARVQAFESDLRMLVGTYRRHAIDPVLVVHQNRFRETSSVESKRLLAAWERFYPRYTGEAILAFDSLGAEATRRVARDSAVALVDASDALRRLDPSKAFADFSHFTDLGAGVVAGIAARAVSARACGPAPR